MPKQQLTLDIVSSIYDTILNPDAWLTAGKKLRQKYHSVYSGLYVYDVRNGALVHSALDGADESFVAEYASEYCYIDPYRESESFMAANPNILLTDKRIHDIFFSIEKNHRQHPYFGEYWHRYDCHHVIGTMYDLPGHLRAGICSPRSASMGAYTQDELEGFEPIRKAFHQAMNLSKHVNQLGSHSAALEQTIKFINQAVYIVDDQRRILSTNEKGNSLLAQQDIVIDRYDRLHATTKQLQMELAHAVTNACHAALGEQRSISRKLNSGPIEILVCPLQNEQTFLKYYNPRAVVFVLKGQVSNHHVLSDIYDLTCTEKQVLRLALDGHSLKQIASSRGTSPETVKSQVKSIYNKTEVNSLVKLRELVEPIPMMT